MLGQEGSQRGRRLLCVVLELFALTLFLFVRAEELFIVDEMIFVCHQVRLSDIIIIIFSVVLRLALHVAALHRRLALPILVPPVSRSALVPSIKMSCGALPLFLLLLRHLLLLVFDL